MEVKKKQKTGSMTNDRSLSIEEISKKIDANNNSPFSKELIIALCWAESSFIPTATTATSTATGLMMMTEPAIQTVNNNTPAGIHFEHSEMTNADKAIAAGTWYLKIIYNNAGAGDKKKTLKKYGTGTDAYANKIIACESCLQSTVVPDKQYCLDNIHPKVELSDSI